jgi:hypothetical protein
MRMIVAVRPLSSGISRRWRRLRVRGDSWSRRRIRWVGAILVAVTAVVAPAGPATAKESPATALAAIGLKDAPFIGLGTWVDVYDYVPGFQTGGAPPSVEMDSVDTMAALGVTTLYLQASQDDARLGGDTVTPALLGSFLRRAHRNGMSVVAWYVPTLDDVNADLRRIRAILGFRSDGERFDAIALDLEWTGGVPDVAARNRALVELSRKARAAVGTRRALGAIVLEPLLLEDVNPGYWPGFPWTAIRSFYDVWLPMAYWTNRDAASGLRDGERYTSENVIRLRARLRDDDAVVHVIGGIADQASTRDYQGFVQAARARKAIGWSVYDFNTTASSAWATLLPER